MTNTSSNTTPPKAPDAGNVKPDQVKQDQQSQPDSNKQADGKHGMDNKPAQQK